MRVSGKAAVPQQRRLEEFSAGSGTDPVPLPVARPRPPRLSGVWRVEDGFVVHPLLRPTTLRALPFQMDMARIGLEEDLLVVLPTGLGKTVIAALLAAEVVRSDQGKVLVLAPTRPLVQQHVDSFAAWFTELRSARFTGTVSRPMRDGRWENAEAVFSTPEIVVNDLASGRYDLKDVGLIVFDEAHHAVGKYAYVAIAERFKLERPRSSRLLGLTASPGSKDARIEEVVRALGVERIEARSREDEGVREHVQPVDIEHRWVKLSATALSIQASLKTAQQREARQLQKMGYLRKKPIGSLSVKDLILLRAEIFARPGPMVRKFGPLFHQLVLLHLHHGLERLETQGIDPFAQYVARVEKKEKPSRGDGAFLRLPEVVTARTVAQQFLRERREASHPKLDALMEAIHAELERTRDHPPRILVFAQYRDTVQGIQERVEGEGITVGRFVGQSTRDAADRGMNQKEQGQVLTAFREGRFPILVASSVAEEGLDVPDVDLVVFFEAIPSEIRAIQRRGRTGRSSLGRVLILLTEETRDVGYQRAEVRREADMARIVRRMSREGRRRRLRKPADEAGAPNSEEKPIDRIASAGATK
jgi:ERCC4-related helicase